MENIPGQHNFFLLYKDNLDKSAELGEEIKLLLAYRVRREGLFLEFQFNRICYGLSQVPVRHDSIFYFSLHNHLGDWTSLVVHEPLQDTGTLVRVTADSQCHRIFPVCRIEETEALQNSSAKLSKLKKHVASARRSAPGCKPNKWHLHYFFWNCTDKWIQSWIPFFNHLLENRGKSD